MSCLFCEIANGNIGSNTIYEDDKVRVILDISPASYGHALILPKIHAESLLECPAAYRDRVFETAQRVGNIMEEKLGCDGINVLANIRPAAGQTVNHFHVHVIPRYKDQPEKDGLHISQDSLESFNMDEICKLLHF